MSLPRYVVTLLGMSPKDRRMIEIVLTRSANKRFEYVVLGEADSTAAANVAVIDANVPPALQQLSEARSRNSNIIAIFVSDDGRQGDSAFRIVRRMLLSQIGGALDHAVVTSASVPAAAAASARADHRGAPLAAAPAQVQDAGPLRAMVIDDSTTVRTQIDAALSRIGFKIEQAANADEASSILLRASFDLVFLDVVMPGTDGYTFCRNVRANKHTKSLPVVMLTSRSSPFDRARGALAGCDTYLVKPIDLKTFHTAVDRVMMRRFKNDRQAAITRGYKLMSV